MFQRNIAPWRLLLSQSATFAGSGMYSMLRSRYAMDRSKMYFRLQAGDLLVAFGVHVREHSVLSLKPY